jgi:hypothetical protein
VLALAIGFVAAPSPSNAQAPARTNPPAERTVPGFAIIDGPMMSIEHVGATHTTSITFVSALRNDDLVPRDLSIEFLPWLTDPYRTPATVAEAYTELYANSGWRTMLQHFGASVAISQGIEQAGSSETLSYMTVAVRTMVLNGHDNPRLAGLMKEFVTKSHELDQALAAQAKEATDTTTSRAADLFTSTRSLVAQLERADKSRVGFMLELGAGCVLRVPENILREAEIGRRAFWLTPIYRFERLPVDLSGIYRYMWDDDTNTYVQDLGGRIGVRRRGISYSIEALGRFRSSDDLGQFEDLHNGRLLGGVTYGFGKSTLLNLSIGKNYRGDFSHGGTLVASFGLTIGLGEMQLDSQ